MASPFCFCRTTFARTTELGFLNSGGRRRKSTASRGDTVIPLAVEVTTALRIHYRHSLARVESVEGPAMPGQTGEVGGTKDRSTLLRDDEQVGDESLEGGFAISSDPVDVQNRKAGGGD